MAAEWPPSLYGQLYLFIVIISTCMIIFECYKFFEYCSLSYHTLLAILMLIILSGRRVAAEWPPSGRRVAAEWPPSFYGQLELVNPLQRSAEI